MTQYVMFIVDVAAVAALVSLFLFRRGRRELVVAYLGVNVGVLAVTTALASGTVSAGLGLGLFGVLSIIRLRSEELAQREIAYYFAALTLGLLGGLASTVDGIHLALMGGVLVAVWIGDHPRLVQPVISEDVLLDTAVIDREALTRRLEGMVGATVVEVKVRRTDLVNDTTLVKVRYRDAGASDRHARDLPRGVA